MGRLCVFTDGDLDGQYGIIPEDGKQRYYYPLDEEHVANWVAGESPDSLEVPSGSDFRFVKVEDLPAEYQGEDYLEYIQAISGEEADEENEDQDEDDVDDDDDDEDERFEEEDE